MLKSLLPKEYKFFDYFDNHIALTKEICREFLEITQNPEKLVEISKRITKLEHDADDIIHVCSEALHKTFITPFERTDIFALIKQLDDVADNVHTAVRRMELYGITDMRAESYKMAEILISCVDELEIAIKGLRNMKEADMIKKKLIRIHSLESEADEILRQAISRLFSEGDAISIIKWKEIFERIEKSIDRCEGVANVVEGILIDNA
jgi:hypothetical protein